MKHPVLPAVFLLAATATCVCHAQSVAQMAQAAINSEGKECARVTTVQVIGKIENGTPLVAAACSDGSRHVLKILANDTFDYFVTCSTLEWMSDLKCF